MLVVVPVMELGVWQLGLGLHGNVEDSGRGCHLVCCRGGGGGGVGDVMLVGDLN